jgi:putative ABC transport system ATP-binding protein
MALIQIEELKKTYNSTAVAVHALKGIDLTIDKGEFTAIVGPSGSGKTTLLNIIGGLDAATSGLISVDGTQLIQLSEAELIRYRLQHIGFVFQAYNLIPVFTALENVEFIMLLQGINKKDRREKATELLNRVGLGDRLSTRPPQLSGGQQQRVAVARALASQPRFVLADEPTANLDSVTAEALLELMLELNTEYNMTFLFSTHDDRVIRKARRVVTLQDGIINHDNAA